MLVDLLPKKDRTSQHVDRAEWHPKTIGSIYPIGSMYAIYGNMNPMNIPQMLAYIPAPWILWVYL